ncbi:MAG TPA: FliH/SctL family protein [Candidatus Baltobacteraceae bacterium]|nr:FliH/SctL family protein [Candidatus Baltobacteraceae bacterium]
MGKIVKEARFSGGAYVVGVPRAEGDGELDERREGGDPFSPPFVEPSSNGHTERITLPEPEHRVDWDALRADAEAIVDRAAADAESLIHQAQAKALELVEAAGARAAQIEEQARISGREQGYAAGKSAGEEELAPVIATIRELIESVRAQRGAAIAAAEPELVRLAMAVAERVIHGELLTNPTVIVENVRQALTRLVSREVVTLRVNPVDLDSIRAHRDEIVAAGDVEHLRIVEDQRVDRGGVIIETDAGTIDSKIATQLREARRAILSDDELALGDAEVLHSPAQAS